MQEIKERFNEGKILEKFDRAMDILQENLKNLPDNLDDLISARTSLENLFLPFATCENLIKIYGPRFEETPNDEDLLIKIIAFLERSDCTDSELYFNVAKNMHQLNPSARSANSMGRMEENNENYLSAIEYYEQALELNDNDNGIDRYSVLMRISSLYNNMNRYSQSRTYALLAAEERPNCGRPWLLIARMYAASVNACAGGDEIQTYAVYWAAADKAIRARNVDDDPDLISIANSMIAAYTARFPNQERLFLLGLDGGQTVRTGCWIGESTVARAR
jgi:tetratricopeptide (TPR) repeat protein